jgi:hypothetical protein
VSGLLVLLSRVVRASARCVPRELRQERKATVLARLAGVEGRDRHG